MTQDPATDSADPPDDPVAILALQCQQYHAALAAATTPGQADILRAEYRQSLEALWDLLADSLRQVARRWMRSHMATDPETLALNMFANIFIDLPKLRIDPQLNVRGLLVTVARRSLIDEYRRNYATTPRRQQASASQQAPVPGTQEAQMWQAVGTPATPASLSPSSPLADPASTDLEERAIAQLDQEAVLKTVWGYWPRTLSKDDLKIMQLRWQSDPQCSFREIAEKLGSGWEEATVRQRHHRILKETRKYLRDQGLIDDHSVH